MAFAYDKNVFSIVEAYSDSINNTTTIHHLPILEKCLHVTNGYYIYFVYNNKLIATSILAATYSCKFESTEHKYINIEPFEHITKLLMTIYNSLCIVSNDKIYHIAGAMITCYDIPEKAEILDIGYKKLVYRHLDEFYQISSVRHGYSKGKLCNSDSDDCLWYEKCRGPIKLELSHKPGYLWCIFGKNYYLSEGSVYKGRKGSKIESTIIDILDYKLINLLDHTVVVLPDNSLSLVSILSWSPDYNNIHLSLTAVGKITNIRHNYETLLVEYEDDIRYIFNISSIRREIGILFNGSLNKMPNTKSARN